MIAIRGFVLLTGAGVQKKKKKKQKKET